jgi:hypothetical protein
VGPLSGLFAVISTLFALGIALMTWWPTIRGWLDRPPTVERGTERATFSFRDARYAARVERDGTAVWERGGADSTPVTAAQARLASTTFDHLPDIVVEAAVKLIATHGAWFEGSRRTTAGEVASELDIRSVRIHPDVRDVNLIAGHRAFSGHVVEVGVTRAGHVRYVGLLG